MSHSCLHKKLKIFDTIPRNVYCLDKCKVQSQFTLYLVKGICVEKDRKFCKVIQLAQSCRL
jgi:hypothetical protein